MSDPAFVYVRLGFEVEDQSDIVVTTVRLEFTVVVESLDFNTVVGNAHRN